MYRIVQRRKIFFFLSLAVILPGLIALIFWGLNLGIDFTGGSLLTISFPDSLPDNDLLRESVEKAIDGNIITQPLGEHGASLRFRVVSPDEHAAILASLQQSFEGVSEKSFETIGPTIGIELRQRAASATIFVLLAIIAYVTWAFRKVSIGPVPSWVYGIATFIALAHDVIAVIGIYAILGRMLGVVIDSLFVTALLTVIGFSVHDTIVVFDRIRERLRVSTAPTFEDTVNESINQTIVRSLNTSFTAILVLLALLVFGEPNLRYFSLALAIGITVGTYSSIFIASPLIVVYYNWRKGRRR